MKRIFAGGTRAVADRVVGPAALATLGLSVVVAADHLLFLPTPLTSYHGLPPLSPLYAFLSPAPLLRAVAPLTFGLVSLALLPRLTRSTLPVAALVLWVATTVLRALFATLRHPLSALGVEFLAYPNEEVLFDARRVDELGGLARFLADYVDLMPQLSLHGSHFPPGHATLQYLVLSLPGADLTALAWVLLLLGSTAVVPVMHLAHELEGSLPAAVVAGSVVLFMPSSVVYGALSTDAVFAALALWPIALAAPSGSRSRWRDLLVGAILGVAAFFSYSAFPLGLLVALLVVARARRRGWRELAWPLLEIGLGFAAVTAAVRLATGFDLLLGLHAAVGHADSLLSSIMGEGLRVWSYCSFGNLVAFLVGLGFATTGTVGRLVVAPSTSERTSAGYRLALTLVATLLLVSVSNLYHLETERILLFLALAFAVPAASALRPLSDRPAWLVLPALLLAQTLVHETLFFTLW